MTSPHPSPPRRLQWLRFAGLVLLALVVASAWKVGLRYQAANELRAAGFWPGRRDVWQEASEDWHDLFTREMWQVERKVVLENPDLPLRNLDAIIPALRRLEIEEIYLTNIRSLENIDGLKNLPGLTRLELMSCTSVRSVDCLKGLTGLRHLRLCNCVELENVDALYGLTSLEEIDLRGCTKLSPESMSALKAALPRAEIYNPFGFTVLPSTR